MTGRFRLPVRVVMGAVVVAVLAAASFLPLAALHEQHDDSVHSPAAPAPVIRSDGFPIESDMWIDGAVQDP